MLYQPVRHSTLLDVDLILDKANIGDQMKVADLGCGTSGHFVFGPAKRVGKKGKVYAIDILKPILETINRRVRQENFTNIETVWSNLEVLGATKIEVNSLDVGLLVNTLYQSHKRVEIIRESLRLIKKGGLLVIVEWKNIALPFGPPPEERVNKEQIKLVLGKMGLKLEEEFDAGQYHYGLVFIK